MPSLIGNEPELQTDKTSDAQSEIELLIKGLHEKAVLHQKAIGKDRIYNPLGELGSIFSKMSETQLEECKRVITTKINAINSKINKFNEALSKLNELYKNITSDIKDCKHQNILEEYQIDHLLSAIGQQNDYISSQENEAGKLLKIQEVILKNLTEQTDLLNAMNGIKHRFKIAFLNKLYSEKRGLIVAKFNLFMEDFLDLIAMSSIGDKRDIERLINLELDDLLKPYLDKSKLHTVRQQTELHREVLDAMLSI